MFGLFCTPKSVAAPRPTARLSLEALESRYAPAALSLNIAYNGGTNVTLSGTLSGTANVAGQVINLGGQAYGQTTTDGNGNYSITENANGLGTVTAVAPSASVGNEANLTDSGATITKFTASEETGGWWEFSGTFTYNYAIQGMTLNLNGTPVDIRNLQYSLDGSGTFDELIQLNRQQSDNGMVAAVVVDAWGVASNSAMQNVQQTGT